MFVNVVVRQKVVKVGRPISDNEAIAPPRAREQGVRIGAGLFSVRVDRKVNVLDVWERAMHAADVSSKQ